MSNRRLPQVCIHTHIPHIYITITITIREEHLQHCPADEAATPEEPQEVGEGDKDKLYNFPLVRQRTIIHLIRHGHTPFHLLNTGEGQVLDVRLSPRGIQQASAIGQQLLSLNAERILVSPLTRALETLKWALRSTKINGGAPVEVTSLHTEHVSCAGDIGRPPEVLASEFPWLSFNHLSPIWWFSPTEAPNEDKFQSRESMEHLRKRVAAFQRYLLSRPEQVIAVIGHSTFFKVLLGEKQRMRNCEFRKLLI